MAERKDYPHGPRGFASMAPERQREISSDGGRAAHRKGTAHRWTREETVEMGRRGGRVAGKGRRKGASAPRP